MVFIVIALLARPVSAQDTVAGWSLYVKGEFATARAHARATAREQGDAAAFALACRAGMVVGGFLETGPPAVKSLHDALEDCEQALVVDKDNYVAGLSHAIALGFEGLRLRKASYARASKREIESLIERYPENALARGALAGWHAAVAREGWLARLFLGASRSRAELLYANAMKLPNVELPLIYEYIRFLAAGDSDQRQKAGRMIEQALETEPNDGLDALLLDRCRDLAAALVSGDDQQLEESLRRATPFEGIDTWGKPDATRVAAYRLPERRN